MKNPSNQDPLAEARAALGRREFERAAQLAEGVLSNDFTNEAAQQIAQQAREKLEAQPFVEQFIQKAREQRAAGNETAAKATIEKARALDADHPGLRELDKSAAAPMSFDFGDEATPFSSAFSATDPGATPNPFTAANPFPTIPEPEPAPEPPNVFEVPEPAPELDIVPPSTPAFAIEEPSPSFVVEPSPSAARAAAEASDFGFTFEEDQKAAAGGAASQVIPGSAGTFDFSTASVEVTAEDKSKIAKYLQEGDEAFAQGEFQKAIDLRSRIFLIDVTNDEASSRIEKARAKRVEIDRKVEDLVTEGTDAFERGDTSTARSKFEEALKLDPTNFAASDYLERLSTGSAPAAGAAAPGAAAAPRPGADLFAEDFGQTAEDADVLMPPPTARQRPSGAVAAPRAVAVEKPKAMMMIVLAGLVVLLAAGGWFALKKLRGGDTAYDATRTAAILTEAQAMAARGEYDRAITLLSAVKPEDPEYERALGMIADFQRKKGLTGSTVAVNPAAFGDLVSRAQAAFAINDFGTAKQLFEQAAAIQPLPAEARSQYETAAQQVTRMQTASVLFKEGNYRDALTALEAMLAKEPQNIAIRQMISNAHFNLGQVALQEERTQEAITHFDHVLGENPSDEVARRSRDLAARYNNERKDLLYKIYVKHLPLRGLS